MGTLEQLAVMPFRPRDVFVGKIAPYFLVATVDLAVIAVVGTVLPSQAKPLIMDGTIREGFLWNPTDAGYAMVAGSPEEYRAFQRAEIERWRRGAETAGISLD